MNHTVSRPHSSAVGEAPALSMSKHHGLGNDFLIAFDVACDDLSALAVRVCDRKRGFGADGLIVGTTNVADGYDARMVLHNADGTRAEISGNGIRCFAQALAARTGSLEPVRIYTDAGDRQVVLEPTNDEHTLLVSVEMGAVAELEAPHNWSATECHPDRPVAHLSVGNPHSVVGVEDVEVVDLADLGARVPSVNLEIVAATARPDTVRMRVHERGVGVTEACGSGAVASAVAAARWGLVVPFEGRVHVEMDGGLATVLIDQPEPGQVTLVGPTTFVGTAVGPAELLNAETAASR